MGSTFSKNVGFRKIGRPIKVKKTQYLRRFDVLRVATGSYTVESKRIASRKLFKRVPGLQDIKNGSKRTKILENRKKNIFLPDFLPYFSFKGMPIFLVWGRRWYHVIF